MLGFSTNPRAPRIVERRGRVPDAAHHRAPHQGGAGAHLKRVVVQFLGTHHPGPTHHQEQGHCHQLLSHVVAPSGLIVEAMGLPGRLLDRWHAGGIVSTCARADAEASVRRIIPRYHPALRHQNRRRVGSTRSHCPEKSLPIPLSMEKLPVVRSIRRRALFSALILTAPVISRSLRNKLSMVNTIRRCRYSRAGSSPAAV